MSRAEHVCPIPRVIRQTESTMELTAELQARCPPETLFYWVEDLSRYTRWMTIVHRAEPEDTADGANTAAGSAWTVDLRAKVGPFSRTKRLRMVRVVCDEPHRAVFERAELDGRDHGRWRMNAGVSPVDGGSRLAMSLQYDGRLWGPAIGAILADEIERSRAQLAELVMAET